MRYSSFAYSNIWSAYLKHLDDDKWVDWKRYRHYKWLKTYAEYILYSIDTAQYKHYMTCYKDDEIIRE